MPFGHWCPCPLSEQLANSNWLLTRVDYVNTFNLLGHLICRKPSATMQKENKTMISPVLWIILAFKISVLLLSNPVQEDILVFTFGWNMLITLTKNCKTKVKKKREQSKYSKKDVGLKINFKRPLKYQFISLNLSWGWIYVITRTTPTFGQRVSRKMYS